MECWFDSSPKYNVTIRKNGGTDAKNEMETGEQSRTQTAQPLHYNLAFHSKEVSGEGEKKPL